MKSMRTAVTDSYLAMAIQQNAAIDAILDIPETHRGALGLDGVLTSAGILDAEGNVQNRATVEILNQTKSTLEVRIDGLIWVGVLWGIQQRLMEFGKAAPEKLIVRIASGGGDAFAGYAVHNFLRTLKSEVVTVADGLTASAAALIFMAGNQRLVAPDLVQVMFHHAMSFIDVLAFGNRFKLEQVDVDSPKRKILQALESIDNDIVAIMVKKSDLDEDKAESLMKDEKFLNGKETLKLGLATGVDEGTSEGVQQAAPADSPDESVETENSGEHVMEETAMAGVDFGSVVDCLFTGGVQ